MLRAQLQARSDAADKATERAEHLQEALDRARADAEAARDAVRAAESKAASERVAADAQRRRTQESHKEALAAARSDGVEQTRQVSERYEARLADLNGRLDGVTDHAQVSARLCLPR